MRLEEHQFGDGTFNRRIVTADDAGFLQMETGVVASHLDASLHALADVDNDLAVAGAFLQGVEQPGALRGIARAEGAHDDGLQIGRVDDVADEVFANAWKQREDDDVVVQPEVGRHGR